LRGDTRGTVSIQFALSAGGVNIPFGGGGERLIASENGILAFGSQTDASGKATNYISLFGATDLASKETSGGASYYPSVGIGTQRSYQLGTFSAVSGDYLNPRNNSLGRYSPFDIYPEGYNRVQRYTWFGLTTDGDSCSSEVIQIAVNDRATSFAGTACADYLTKPHYFGQIETRDAKDYPGDPGSSQRDVGSRTDGDFDLFIGLGFDQTFQKIFFCPDGSIACSGNSNTYPDAAIGGFHIGNQEYFFTASQVINGTFLNEFRFRNGVACAVLADNSCSGNFTVSVVDPGGGGGSVPTPGVALLLLLGGIGLARARPVASKIV
jgi:hypothetical protein